ncbi:lipase family protein [Rhizobium sp. YIM 134829]|uniref:lipase family protein n=1 Tax=Rhizobium sp. YIM 134829 TaxID=3390453 RepID=UPI003978DE11
MALSDGLDRPLLAGFGEPGRAVPEAGALRPAPDMSALAGGTGRIATRLVVHCPGFEPLDAGAHRARYQRAARQSAAVHGLAIEVGPLEKIGSAGAFTVTCRNPEGAGPAGETTSSRIVLIDHASLVAALTRRPLAVRLASGALSALRVVGEGGLAGYLRHGWRFALFFLFPFLMVGLMLGGAGLGAALPLILGLSPLHLIWSLPAAVLLFTRLLLPLGNRFHCLLLFADWQMAVAIARQDRPAINEWLTASLETMRQAIDEAGAVDEIVVSGHSMGASIAAMLLGSLIERDAALLEGRRVTMVTLGSAILQCALLRSASLLRADVGRIARFPGLRWIDVQCLTDPIHFYKAPVVALCGHPDSPPAAILQLRLKQVLSPERYRRIRLSFLRVHRQYVLGPDRPARFDFTLLTAGPSPAASLLDR